MSVQTAVVLAAGEGTRLRPMTRNRPKPMLPAANRPIIEHVLDALVEAGMEKLVFVVGYRRQRVQEHFGPSYRSVPIEYVVQDKQLGSGHALLQARSAVDGKLLVVNGDRLIEAESVRTVATALQEESVAAAMAVIERMDTSKYGAVRLHDRDVSEIVEKPESDEYRLINAGIYAFESTIFDAIEETPEKAGELGLTDTLARMITHSRVRGVEIDGLWVDATYPWDLLEVCSEVLARGRVRTPQQTDGIWLADDALVHEDATLRPPVVVDPDCEVGPGAVIGPNVALGRNSTVGANATIERSLIDADTRIGHGSTIVDGVFGQDVHVGVDATIPGGPGDVRVDQRVFESQKLGAVIADRARIGGNVSFAPGTLVGSDTSIETGVRVSGTVPSDSVVMR